MLKMQLRDWKRRAVAVSLALTMAPGLCACGSSGGSTEKIMTTAKEKLEEAESMRYDVATGLTLSAEGQTIQIDVTGKAECIFSPMQMKLDTTTDMGDMGAMSTIIHMVEEDGAVASYTGMDDGTGTMLWMKQTLEDMGTMSQYDANSSFSLYLDSAEHLEACGIEPVHDFESTRYDGVITRSGLKEVLTASGILSQLESLGMDTSQAASMLTGIGDAPISIWVDNESGMPVKYDIDMTAVLQGLMQNLLAEMGGEGDEILVEKATASMTVTDIDSVETIKIPAEALAA